MKKIILYVFTVMTVGTFSGCYVYSQSQEAAENGNNPSQTYVKKLVCDSIPNADGSLRCRYEYVPVKGQNNQSQPRTVNRRTEIILPPVAPAYYPYYSPYGYWQHPYTWSYPIYRRANGW